MAFIYPLGHSGLYIMTLWHRLFSVMLSISLPISGSFSTPNRERMEEATLSIETSLNPFIYTTLIKEPIVEAKEPTTTNIWKGRVPKKEQMGLFPIRFLDK